MRTSLDLTNFSAGELSPKMKGRFDQAKYFNGCATLYNMVALPQGGSARRPGSMYVATSKDQVRASRIVPFIFSTVQAYALDFSQGNVRVYMNDAVVLSGGVPVDIVVPYQATELAALKFTQSADTLYICHPKYPPATLTRSSHTSWTYAATTFLDGPYLPQNTTATVLNPNATTGNIIVTASAGTGINNGAGFLAGDVGRLIRIKVSAVWGWVKITSINNDLSVNATVQAVVNNGAAGALDGTGPTAAWMLGKWCTTTGFPYAPTFWQQRLMMAGTDNQPNAIEGSRTGDFPNFAPSKSDGTVLDTSALSWVISDDQVNAIRWLSSAGSAQTAQLGIGTLGGENILQPGTTGQALTPTNVQAYRETAYGAASNVNALRVGKSVLFANRPGRKVHEWTFSWQVNGYLGPDLTVLAEHITKSGIAQWTYQQSPHSIVWAVRNDGQLIGMTYWREQDIVAWHRHQLGGQYYGGAPIVESLCCIPSPDGTYDEVWLTVLRTIAGVPTRFVEVLTKFFDGQPSDEAFFVDAGLSTALTFPAATLTPPATLANKAHTGDFPALTGTGTFSADAPVFGAGDVNKVLRVNGGKVLVTAFTDTQHIIGQVLVALTSAAPSAANAWSLTAKVTSITGLNHLAGETVAIVGDGASLGTQTVSGGGGFTINKPGASYVTAGLHCKPALVTMPAAPQRLASLVSGGRAGTMHTLYVRFHETLGCTFGRRILDPLTLQIDEATEPLESRSAGDSMDQAPPLFSGMERLKPPSSYDQECQILVSHDEPLPLTVLAFSADLDMAT